MKNQLTIQMSEASLLPPKEIYSGWKSLANVIENIDKMLLKLFDGSFSIHHTVSKKSTLEKLIVDIGLDAKGECCNEMISSMLGFLNDTKKLIIKKAADIHEKEDIDNFLNVLETRTNEFTVENMRYEGTKYGVSSCTINRRKLIKTIKSLRSIKQVLDGSLVFTVGDGDEGIHLNSREKINVNNLIDIDEIISVEREGTFLLSWISLNEDAAWKSIFMGEKVDLVIDDIEFKSDVLAGKVPFRGGDALRCRYTCHEDPLTKKTTYRVKKKLKLDNHKTMEQQELDLEDQ